MSAVHYLLTPLKDGLGLKSYHIKRLESLVGTRYVDLLFHWPVQIRERYGFAQVSQARLGEHVSLCLQVFHHHGGSPYRVEMGDDTGRVNVVFFHGKASFLKQKLKVSQKYIVQGWLESFKGHRHIIHPHIMENNSAFFLGRQTEPIYPLTSGITEVFLKSLIQRVLSQMLDLPFFDAQSCSEDITWKKALQMIHHPQNTHDLSLESLPRQLLYREEVLAQQLCLKKVRFFYKQHTAFSSLPDSVWRQKCLDVLPFSLTNNQSQIMSILDREMSLPERMVRLIQGDVGSGKTALAFLALTHVVHHGYQGFLMAPTEILARQHFQTFQMWSNLLEIPIEILTSQELSRNKKEILKRIKTGFPCLVVGTHALLEENVSSENIGLFVVDEQHRFGVQQRIRLIQKNPSADFLMLTATPIPRTLQLSSVGDLDISSLKEKPPGRQPVQTIALPLKKISDIYEKLVTWIQEEHKVYWICPLIEASESLHHITSCEQRFSELNDRFQGLVGYVHGRCSGAEKQKALEDFLEGAFKILVATTAIEVGVNVPDATIMIIEHAERFGLAQLHQLRGRIGRGAQKGLCLLLYGPLTPLAQERLSIMRQTNDGFVIAEKDLELRGPGDVLGLRQTGERLMRLGPPLAPCSTVEKAEILASEWLCASLKDPKLAEKIDELLKIFQRDAVTMLSLQ